MSTKHDEICVQWAKALIEASKQENLAETVQEDLIFLLVFRRTEDQLWSQMANPFLPKKTFERALRASFGGKICELTIRFLTLLARKRRMDDLGGISQQFGRLLDESQNRWRSQVKSAFELDEQDKEMLKNALALFIHKQRSAFERKQVHVNLDIRVDSNLIGGLVVRVGDWLIDQSLKTQLGALKEALSI